MNKGKSILHFHFKSGIFTWWANLEFTQVHIFGLILTSAKKGRGDFLFSALAGNC
jgi:hypothetical protein